MGKDQDTSQDNDTANDAAREAGKTRAAELLAAAEDENWLGI